MNLQKLIATLLAIIILFTPFYIVAKPVIAQSEEEKLSQLTNQIEEFKREIERLQSQANTLKNQIAQYDAQITLTTLKITETEEKIALLGGRINLIENSLESLTQAFNNRVRRTYKMTRLGNPIAMVLSSDSLTDAVSSFHYLKKIQQEDKDLLVRLEDTKQDYTQEKTSQEELQDELEIQKKTLAGQKAAKSNLLVVTKNDEKQYQELLAAAEAEYEAIQAIIAGRGQETKVGRVSEGEKIASVIQGASCNSSGGHLHFIVSQGGKTQNPFNHLKPGVGYDNCSGSSCGSGDGDSFNPSGLWNWPILEPIKFNQGYGYTWAVQNTWAGRIYQFHNGIDINNQSNSIVKAVQSGDLYQGSYSGSAGCRLRYVRVDHDNSDLETYYLHINY